MIHTDVTCPTCLDRQRTINGQTFRDRFRVGSPSRTTGTPMARGHAMYHSQGFIISLCVALPKVKTD